MQGNEERDVVVCAVLVLLFGAAAGAAAGGVGTVIRSQRVAVIAAAALSVAVAIAVAAASLPTAGASQVYTCSADAYNNQHCTMLYVEEF